MADQPEVSIVVTTFNGWRLTKKCLESLVRSAGPSALSAEIILSDNCSTDDTPEAWRAFQNDKWPIRYSRNRENLGYLRNANAGAMQARGRFLCLMNNDVIVPPGWLDGLVEVLRDNAGVGLVGPKYLDAKGRVVESGCVLFNDASAIQLGRGTALTDPGFSYLNDVHYCSMACVVLRTELFRDLNGYDERYLPAYYEDADLCLRVQERGLRVAVNPCVRIKHLFGGSYEYAETLRLMDKNRPIFRARWKDRLERLHPAPDMPVARLRSCARGSTIVFHWPRIADPRSAAGALRNWQLMQEARERGHHVVLVTLSGAVERPFLDVLQRQGIEVHQVPIGDERELVRELVDAHAISAAVLSFGVSEERYGYLYDQFDPKIIRVFDTVDVHFIRELRAARRDASAGAVQRLELDRLPMSGYAELASMLRSDAVLVVSEEEKRILTREMHLPAGKFHVVGTMHPVAPAISGFAEREGFSFIGSGGHLPNVDAIEYLVSAIWPGIREELPQANLYVYGFELPPKIRALHEPARGVVISGFVEDHRAALAASRVMLAPIRFGAGVKGKIGEALAVGTPVITTPVGAEGIDEQGQTLCVEADARQFARRAAEIHRQEDEWNRRSRLGLDLVRERFSAAAAGERLMESIEAGRRIRGESTAWQHIAYAAMAKQKIHEDPGQLDIPLRIGWQVTGLLRRMHRIRNPFIRRTLRALHRAAAGPAGTNASAPARDRSQTMNMEVRLNAIESKPLRYLAKGAYYTATLQIFRRWGELRAREGLKRLAGKLQIAPLPFGPGPWLDQTAVRSRQEYEQVLRRPEWQARARIEHLLAYNHRDEQQFSVSGYSILAGLPVDFLVDRQYGSCERDGVTFPSWRERLVCPVTQLTNRQRAMMLFLQEHAQRVTAAERRPPDLFLFEQVSALYRYIRETRKGWNTVGSEWLGSDIAPGTTVNGIRHEDCAALSLPDRSVDLVMSLDVFEHVPDPRRGFEEKARVLRPGGTLLMTVPFFPDRDATVRRARLEQGRIEHLLPAEYHGNPVDPAGGSLVYHDFGWDLLAMIRSCGFSDAHAALYWSLDYGHLGAPQMVFVATR